MKKLLISLLLLTSFLQISCSPETISNSITTNPVDVYVAGSKNGLACYWKNNQLVMLNSGVFTNTFLTKIIVSNGNIYAFGRGSFNNYINTALLWKNGVLSNLETQLNTTNYPYFRIDDMDIVGNDEYFIGSYNNASSTEAYTAYWKNGVKTIVTDFINTHKFKVHNNNVYVVFDANATNNGYFLNGVFNEIQGSYLLDFAVNNNEISVFGYNNYPINLIHNITTNTDINVGFPDDDQITNLCFDNNNMYYSNTNKIYKNGALFSPAPSVYSGVLKFNVLNDNLYVIRGFGANPAFALEINDVTIMQSGTDETFSALYIVQN